MSKFDKKKTLKEKIFVEQNSSIRGSIKQESGEEEEKKSDLDDLLLSSKSKSTTKKSYAVASPIKKPDLPMQKANE